MHAVPHAVSERSHVQADCAMLLMTAVSPAGHATEQILWLPTACLQLLQHICKARPNHLIIAADFDELPDVAVPGRGAPLVACTVCTACSSAALQPCLLCCNHAFIVTVNI